MWVAELLRLATAVEFSSVICAIFSTFIIPSGQVWPFTPAPFGHDWNTASDSEDLSIDYMEIFRYFLFARYYSLSFELD